MALSDQSLRALFQLSRLLKESDLTPMTRTERLYDFLFENDRSEKASVDLRSAQEWDVDSLKGGMHLSEEIVALYAHYYHDVRLLPVTYYKREKRVRRHLDLQFSTLYHELGGRLKTPLERELITEEPIYYLMQIAREKRFPKDRNGLANLDALRSRFKLDLSQRLSDEEAERSRKVLLPHEIRRR